MCLGRAAIRVSHSTLNKGAQGLTFRLLKSFLESKLERGVLLFYCGTARVLSYSSS